MRNPFYPQSLSSGNTLVQYERYAVNRAALILAQEEFREAISIGVCQKSERLVNDANQLLREAYAKK